MLVYPLKSGFLSSNRYLERFLGVFYMDELLTGAIWIQLETKSQGEA